MAKSGMVGGVYHPRAKGGALQDALADARRAMNRLMRMLALRGAGMLLIAAALAGLVTLVSYSPDDASLNNANLRDASNWLGAVGATAADLMLQLFGFAAIAFLAPLLVWGTRAVRGKSVKHAMWRLVAWPLGTATVAAGLGLFARPQSLPAGAGGMIGIAASGLSAHAAQVWHTPAVAWALPLTLLLAGLPLAFLATGLRFMPLYRGAMNIPATAIWLWGLIKKPDFSFGHHDDADDHDHAYEDDDEGAYHLDAGEPGAIVPESIAATRLAERQKNRVKRDAAKPQTQTKRAEKQTALNLGNGEYQLPGLDLLTEAPPHKETHTLSDEALEENARMLEAVLADFGVKGRITAVRPGPVVTLYEFEPAAGVKSSRVVSLSDDVARSMSAVAARIATISGRNVIGIELPNQYRETVYLREMFSSPEYDKARAPLTMALGKTIGGEPVMADLAKMPHLLVAGTTGSGKSVGLNTMILSLLYRMSPQQCRLIMIDPKMLELSVYDGIPHLLSPVVTDPRKAIVALKWAVREMEDRYRKMSKMGVRGLEAFNERVTKAKEKGESLKRTVQTGFDRETGKPVYEDESLEFEALPFIVVVVDEMADLMMVAGKEIEAAVQRLAQMARAAGIHVIMATQRPSVDVITGTIKANFPTRISFTVISKFDSRTILGEQGAEQLLGQGDMLYMAQGGRIKRVHGPFVSDQEVEGVVAYLRTQGEPDYVDEVTEAPENGEDVAGGALMGADSELSLFDQAVDIVSREGKASTSFLQRHLNIGYNRAAKLIEQMEKEGIITAANHVGKREVLARRTNHDDD